MPSRHVFVHPVEEAQADRVEMHACGCSGVERGVRARAEGRAEFEGGVSTCALVMHVLSKWHPGQSTWKTPPWAANPICAPHPCTDPWLLCTRSMPRTSALAPLCALCLWRPGRRSHRLVLLADGLRLLPPAACAPLESGLARASRARAPPSKEPGRARVPCLVAQGRRFLPVRSLQRASALRCVNPASLCHGCRSHECTRPAPAPRRDARA